MRYGLLFFLCVLTVIVNAQIPDFSWVKVTKLGNYQGAQDMVIDDQGNSYTTGYFRGNTDFDPGPGTFMLNGGSGGHDIFVLKLSAAGNFIWAKQFVGSVAQDNSKSIAIDSSGNIYIAGDFVNTVDFDPGIGVYNLTSNGGGDAFVVKLSNAGNLIWARSFGGIDFESVHSIHVNNSYELVLSGVYRETVDFDPGVGVTQKTSMGYQDGFICKYTTDGIFQWVNSYGGSWGNDAMDGAIFDETKNIYVIGCFSETVDLDPGPDTLNYTSVSTWQDLFVQKLDSSGTEVWTSVFHGNGLENGASIKYDPMGNIYCTGRITEPVDFDPGPASFVVPSIPNQAQDCFLLKLSAATGSFGWVKLNTGPGSAGGTDLAIDTLGNIFMTGGFSGMSDFDSELGDYSLVSTPTSLPYYSAGLDCFITKLTPSGDMIWAFGFGGNDQDNSFSIALGDSGYIYTCGLYHNIVDFDPGAAVFDQNGTPVAAFVYRINECFPGISTSSHSACGSFTWINGLTYTSSNTTAKHILANASTNGCDSIIQLNLTIRPHTTSTQVISACSSYTWINGVTYSASTNIPTYTIPNSAGCDSIITLHLTIHQPITTTLNVVSCNSYTWPTNGIEYFTSGTYNHHLTTINGCDSMVQLNLTIGTSNSGSESQVECDNYIWPANGVNYTSSGIHSVTLQNLYGCDSIATLNLTILHSSNTSMDIESCDSYLWANGVTYTTSGEYNHTVTNSSGCDSVITLNLIIHQSDTTVFVVDTCDTFTWASNGNSYQNSGTYITTFSNIHGCDSIIILDLTIHSSNSIQENILDCDQYEWPVNGNTYTLSGTYVEQFTNQYGCDSIRTLNLILRYSTSSNLIVEECDSYLWTDGNMYTTSGSYSQTLTNVSGCDSISYLDLTISPTPAITANGLTLSASVSGASYQWIDCKDYTEIPGQNDQFFTATSNGNYGVIVNLNECIDTTDCIEINDVGLVKNELVNLFTISPNPAQHLVHIDLINTFKVIEIQLMDLNGKMLQYQLYDSTDQIDLIITLPAGMYFIKILADGNLNIAKLMVE
jgi:hypothetical protein